MIGRQQRVADMLSADPDVDLVSVRLGSGRQGGSAQFIIQLRERKAGRQATTNEVLARLTKQAALYPDLELRLRAIQDLPSEDGGGSSRGASEKTKPAGQRMKKPSRGSSLSPGTGRRRASSARGHASAPIARKTSNRFCSGQCPAARPR